MTEISTHTEIALRQFDFDRDYAAARDLWVRSEPGIHLGPSDEPGEIRKKLARDPELFLVAEADGGLIGTVIGGFDGRRGIVYHLAVEPAYRQHGVGTALMDELERRLQALGCIRAYLLIVDGNEEVCHYYETRGWGRIPVMTYGKNLTI
jgi:ribosomal protein S18 acetylase RimI-like enzyme